MDATYIKNTVGPALAEALAHIAQVQPEDPIDYLSAYLKKYSNNTNQRAVVRSCSKYACNLR
jgi:hypothetical protein